MAHIEKSKAGSAKRRYANRDTRSTGLPISLGVVTLDTVYTAFQDMIFTKDRSGRITSANEAFAKYVNATVEGLIGKTAYEMDGVMPELADSISMVDEQVMQTQCPFIKREWQLFADGSKNVYVEQVTTPLIDNGESVGVLVIIKDLTELKMAMDEVERQNEILETIGKVSALMLEPDINAFTHSIYEAMEIIAKGIGAHRIDIWRLRGAGDEAYYSLEYDWTRDRTIGNLFESSKDEDRKKIITVDDKVIPFMEGLLTKGKPINGIVGEMPLPVQEMFWKNGIEMVRSALIMPIILSDEYWGFIGAFDVEEERKFSENEELLLRSSRRMIASAMTRMEITKDLMHQTDRLRYELVTKRDFFARMSHEIRTPMNAILGMTELALRERMSNAANEYIMTVKQTGMNLLTIINDILDFSKIESGNLEIMKQEYALSSLIYDIVSIIRMRLAYTRIRFIVDIDSNLPCGLVGDEGKIRQILINLLGNAVKYTQKGYIKLTVKGEVKSSNDMLHLWLVVTDSGKGIKEEDQAKLFRDYIQVDKEKNAGIEGVGLGLSITNGLVLAMNGTISLVSEYGKGSEFAVMLPQKIVRYDKIARVDEPERKTTLIYERRKLYVDTLTGALNNLGIECDVVDNSDDVLDKMATGSYAYLIGSVDLMVEIRYQLQELAEKQGEFQIIGIAEYGDETDSVWRTLSTPIHTISLANTYNGDDSRYVYTEEDSSIRFSAPEAKVLIVDDIATNLKVAAGLLAIFDVEIDVCGSGEEAIDLVRENNYDIVFMDHKMPGMDGVETTQAIRELGNNVPIVALTANVMANMKEMFISSGFNDYIGKPIDTVVLADVMRRWIPRSKQRRYFAPEPVVDDTAKHPETGITFTIPGVDIDKGFRTAGGKMDVYLDILSTFLDEATERQVQLYEFLEAGNIRMYTISVHALKGALANIGATELSELAAKIEAAGEKKDMEFIEKNNEHFISGIGRLLTSIKSVLSETAKNVSEGKKSSKQETERFVSTLMDLRNAISDMNAGTMNKALEHLLSDALTEQSLSTVRTISRHILMAEYDDAEQMIDNLIKAFDG